MSSYSLPRSSLPPLMSFEDYAAVHLVGDLTVIDEDAELVILQGQTSRTPIGLSSDDDNDAFSSSPGPRRMFASGSDPGVDMSTPVRCPQDRAQKARVKAGKTRSQKKTECVTNAEAKKTRTMKRILAILDIDKISLAEFLLYAFGKKNKNKEWRWMTFFSKRQSVHKILSSWLSTDNSLQARKNVCDWIVNYIGDLLDTEATEITRTKLLYCEDKSVNSSFILDFNTNLIQERLEEVCPVTTNLLGRIATTKRQKKHATESKKEFKRTRIVYSALTLLAIRSQKNNYLQHILGLYLYATGASRQQIAVYNHLGQSVSYSTIVGRGSANYNRARALRAHGLESSTSSESEIPAITSSIDDRLRVYHIGTLKMLSESAITENCKLANKTDFLTIYDNINVVWKVGEQIMGRTDSQENGTSVTIVPLFKATAEALSTEALHQAMDNAVSLSLEDIKLSTEEKKNMRTNLIYTVTRICVQFGGEKMQKFRTELQQNAPHSEHKIEVHQSDVRPVMTRNINESTTVGNGEVMDATFKELKVKEPEKSVKLVAGDQLSIARLWSIAEARTGSDSERRAMGWIVHVPGLFHYKMSATNGILQTHFGKPNRDMTNPASLCAHNTLLQRKPIVITSPPPFRICRDLIFTSLYARVLHCVLLVSSEVDLESLADNSSWEDLLGYSAMVVDQFTNAPYVGKLRNRRRLSPLDGDMVMENAILFMRDALYLREMTDAVKVGDSGRIVLVLKIWALSFRGNGRLKYAYETLSFIHNITNVWPKPLVKVVLNNWLANTSGTSSGFVEADLIQEHLNYWIKNFYQAHGSAASWEWLETITPCLNTLRKLSNEVNSILGSKQGNHHSAPDLTEDIATLMKSLSKHDVYTEQKGRRFETDDAPAIDCIGVGTNALSWGMKTPLDEFNAQFEFLKKKHRQHSLINSNGSHNEKSRINIESPVVILNNQETEDGSETDNGDDTSSLHESDAASELDFETQTDAIQDLDLVSAEDVELDMDGYDDNGGFNSKLNNFDEGDWEIGDQEPASEADDDIHN